MKILVVDDNESILTLLNDILSRTGFNTVSTALSAKEAMQLIRSEDKIFDCFVVDIQMPEIDGIELTRFIRNDPRYATTPVIILTAMQQRAYLDQAFAVGATDYVTKPFNFVELRKLIQSAHNESLKKAARPELAVADGKPGQSSDTFGQNFEEAVPLPKVGRALGKVEFENYVVQLSKRRLTRSAILAIKIRRARSLYFDNTEVDFLRMISATAQMIEGVYLTSGGALSYRGSGLFLVTTGFKLRNPFADYAVQLNKEYERANGLPASPDLPELIVGNPVALRKMKRFQALDCLTSAVENVDHYYASTSKKKVAHRAFLRSPSLPDKQRLERLSYENLLRDVTPEETESDWLRILHRRLKRSASY
jgi:CheY-like chemotaxis protein